MPQVNVWVAPVGKLDEAKAITHDRGRGVTQYFWAYEIGRAHV